MTNKKRCEKCGSTQTYFRIKTSDWFCRDCCHIEKVKSSDRETK